MKPISIMMFALLAAGVAAAQLPEGQVPVREGVEAEDSPTADQARGDTEADRPGVEPSSSDVEQPPPPDQQPGVEQPAVEP